MSSSNALATVTATLQRLLSNVAPSVTTQPPSTARNGNGAQINIFLYSTYYNTAFSNAPMPGEIRNGETALPPLPLVLKYLITAYGDNDEDISGQQLMGTAMSILHDHPVLGRSVIDGIFPDSGLHEQFERVRITPDALSLDDMSKLWTSFQSAEYRLSTGYEVSVVLIESTRVSRAPLPVVKRGEDNQGAHVVAAPTASLTGLRFPDQKPSAELGDRVILLGEHLTDENTTVRFQHPDLDAPIDIQPEPTQIETEMAVQLPAVADDLELGSKWPAGFYTLSLLIQHPDAPNWMSNSLSLPLSPTIESIDPVAASAGNIVLTLECMPQIAADQSMALLFSDSNIATDAIFTPADPTARTTLTFSVENVLARELPYVLRIRVDGVDSIPVDFSGDTPQFADSQKVTIS